MHDSQSSIDWSPASDDSINYCTHEIREDEHGKIKFVPTDKAVKDVFIGSIYQFVFISIFLFLMLGSYKSFLAGSFTTIELVFSLFICVWVSVLFLYTHIKRIRKIYISDVFEPNNNLYSTIERGWFNKKRVEKKISSINTIQIIPKGVRGHYDADYMAYELNLLFDKNERKNILCHSSYEDIKFVAEKLGRRLGVKVIEGDRSAVDFPIRYFQKKWGPH